MRQYDRITLPSAPLLLQIALEHAGAHGIRLDLLNAVVDVPLPLLALPHVLIAFNQLLYAHSLKFAISPYVLFVLVDQSQMVELHSIGLLVETPVSAVL